MMLTQPTQILIQLLHPLLMRPPPPLPLQPILQSLPPHLLMPLLRRRLVILLLLAVLDLPPERVLLVFRHGVGGGRVLGVGGGSGGGGGRGWAFGDAGAGAGFGRGGGGGGLGGLGFLLFDAAGLGAFELEAAADGGGVVVASHGAVGVGEVRWKLLQLCRRYGGAGLEREECLSGVQ